MRKSSDKTLLVPTDLSNFLSCHYLSALDLSTALGQTERPVRYNPMTDELRSRGFAREQGYLERLVAQGLTIVDASDNGVVDQPVTASLERTLQAMRGGADLIYQATLSDDTWYGRADFLCKVNTPSDLGDWSYEVTDAKLVRDCSSRTGERLGRCGGQTDFSATWN